MRIAQVAPLIESVPPKLYGGTERVVSYLTDELVRRGHDVTLFASGDSITSARLVPGCPEALRLRGGCVDPWARHITMVEEVFSRRDEFDIIHFHIDYVHLPTARRERIVHVSTLHGRLDIPDLNPLYRRFADAPLISISQAQQGPLPFANWLGTVYHGLPQDRYVPSDRPGTYLAFLGRLSPEKGVDQAIEIAKRTGIPLKIAAKVDHVDQKYFECKVRPLLDHPLVEFIGEIGYAEKNDFLRNALCLLFPINWPEPFGLVMIEAMACGTPVVAYPRGSVREIISDGRNGFLVTDAEQAARAVERIGEISRRECRQIFEKRFTTARMADDYLSLYQKLIPDVPESLSLADGVPVA
jgi:glycosyltransferase involved in cell wall biosynthesis